MIVLATLSKSSKRLIKLIKSLMQEFMKIYCQTSIRGLSNFNLWLILLLVIFLLCLPTLRILVTIKTKTMAEKETVIPMST